MTTSTLITAAVGPTFTRNQFLREANNFRTIMTDANNTIEYIDRAFGCLFLITARTDPHDRMIDSWWNGIVTEWLRRKELMILHGAPCCLVTVPGEKGAGE